MKGIFTISLDFELHWGCFDKHDRETRAMRYLKTLELIPQLLHLFEENEVHVTWAAVGSLLAGDQKEWEKMKPSIEPDYVIEKYSPYKWVKQNGLAEKFYWAHFAPEAIDTILKCEGQELGTHTFSHYYCLEQQHNDRDAFDEDLKSAIKAAKKFDSKPVSLVFPRNQFNPRHLKICYDNGIKVVRSNPPYWFWSPVQNNGSNLLRKLFRTADAYMKVDTKRASYPLKDIKIIPGEPVQLPASRLLRPLSKNRFVNQLSIQHVCRELKTAAIRNECYHLWWHPESFGEYTEENLQYLQNILQEFRRCKQQYGMESWNMGEYAKYLVKDHTISNNEPATSQSKQFEVT